MDSNMPDTAAHTIDRAGTADVDELLVLMRAYCDFYETSPSDDSLRALAAAMIADPEHEGVQLLARERNGRAVAFASVYWSWDTTVAARIGIMNDLFVAPPARGSGLADALIERCMECCRERGAARLEWQTALENHRAQAVYDRAGGVRGSWLSYSRDVR
jgi:GNAT superfamily N-acetyltransferase